MLELIYELKPGEEIFITENDQLEARLVTTAVISAINSGGLEH